MKRCPFCAEEVQDAAIVCRFCNADLVRNERPAVGGPSRGIAAVLSLVIPGAGQMYRGSVGQGIVWLVGTVVCYLVFGVFGFVLHLICVFSAAASVSAPAVARSAPREQRTEPKPPSVPPDPPPLWLKAAFGGGLAVIVIAAAIASYLPPAYFGRGSTVPAVYFGSGSTPKPREPRPFSPIDVFTEPHTEGLRVISRSDSEWTDCVATIGDSSASLAKIPTRASVVVTRDKFQPPLAEVTSELARSLKCASKR